MMEKLKNNIEIYEEKSIKNTYLCVKNININAESYESKILSEDNIESIIKYQVAYDGEQRILKYDVSNTASLEEYIKHRKLKKKDLCEILTSIDDMLSSLENFLVSENSIPLDLKFIRIERVKERNKYKFIGIPNYHSSFSFELSKLLIKILRYVDVDDKEAISLGYGLFVRSSKDNYTISDLMELVDIVKDNNDTLNNLTTEDILRYDEEMAKEISEEIIEENKFNFEDLNEQKETEIFEDENDEEIAIDRKTKQALGESILNDFNKDDKKVLKFQKQSFKKKKALSGHISLRLLMYLIVPIIILVIPFISYIVFGGETFIKNIPIIIGIVLMLLVIILSIQVLKYKVSKYESIS